KNDPVSAFRFAHQFAHRPWAGPKLLEVAPLAAASALKYVRHYMAAPEHNNIMDAAVGALQASGTKIVCDKIYPEWKDLFDPEVTYLSPTPPPVAPKETRRLPVGDNGADTPTKSWAD